MSFGEDTPRRSQLWWIIRGCVHWWNLLPVALQRLEGLSAKQVSRSWWWHICFDLHKLFASVIQHTCYCVQSVNAVCIVCCVCRLRWSHTFLMIRYVMSAPEFTVVASLRHSSVPTWPVCSTTVSHAGHGSTRRLDVSSTSRSLRKELTGRVLCRSVGVKMCNSCRRLRCFASADVCLLSVWLVVCLSVIITLSGFIIVV